MSKKTTDQIAARLVELCRTGAFDQAMEELYAPDAWQHEAISMPGKPQTVRGKAALREAAKQWNEATQVHGCWIEGPWPCGDRFIVTMEIDVTHRAGPMAGQRLRMKEACLYETRDGFITGATFFYGMG